MLSISAPAAFAAIALALSAGPTSAGQDQLHPDFAELGARWAAALEDLDVPGMAVVVMEGDRIVHLQTFGLRDVVERKPVTPDTLFYIASATKPFIAFALQQMVREGRIELDAPVRDYLPRFELADERMQREMTVRDLLCHRPGLSSGAVVFLDAYTGGITEDRYYHHLAKARPTGQVEYTNVHFTLAGRVLEAVAGEPWKDALERWIFTPAGMQRTTGYADDMYADRDVAFPTVWLDGALTPSSIRKTNATMHAAGGLGTTITDLARWIGVQLSGGQVADGELLDAAALEEMLTLQSSDSSRAGRGIQGFGLGWMLGTFEGERLAQHGGGYVGSAALISFLPDVGLGVAVLANSDVMGNSLCALVTEDVFSHLLVMHRTDPLPQLVSRWERRRREPASTSPTRPNPAASPEHLTLEPSEYVGAYENPHWGTIQIALDEGELAGRMGNVRFSLHALGTDRVHAFAARTMDAELSFLVARGEVVGLEADFEEGGVEFRH